MPNLDKEIEVALARVERLKEKKRIAEAIMYAHFGKRADVKQSHAATWRSDFRNPYDAIMSIESMFRGTGRKNQTLMVIQLFSKDELDPRDPMTPTIVADATYALAKEVALSRSSVTSRTSSFAAKTGRASRASKPTSPPTSHTGTQQDAK